MGAGAIGGYVGGRLAEAGLEVTLIARGANLAALRENGLTLETPDGNVALPDIRAVEDPAEVGEVDLILFAVKMSDADAGAAQLRPMMGAQTRILAIQNGIDSKDVIEAHTGAGTVAVGAIYLAAYIRAPGVIWYPGGIHMLTVDRMGGDPVMAQLFEIAPRLIELDIVPSDNPRQALWDKFVNLAALSAITSLTRSTIGRVLEVPESLAFLRALSAENIAVARAEGVSIPENQTEFFIQRLAAQPYEMKSSMLFDLEAGKALELPWLSGRIVALAEQHGIDVPANRAVVAALAPHVGGASGV
jgi:2-dehydropantoate 2-reductase